MFRRKKDETVDSKTPDASLISGSGVATVNAVESSPLRGEGKRSPFSSPAIHQEIPRRGRVEPLPTRHHGRPSEAYEGKKLIVGRDIELTGEITACDRLVVEGKVVADLVNTATLEVARTGVFRGSAEVDHADISGLFDGALTVRCKLIIRSTGKVCGTIRYARLVIELCGEIFGTVAVLSNETKLEGGEVCPLTPPLAEEESAPVCCE